MESPITISALSYDYDYWNFYINRQPASLGIANQAIDNGDEILLFYGNYYTALTDVEYVLEEESEGYTNQLQL